MSNNQWVDIPTDSSKGNWIDIPQAKKINKPIQDDSFVAPLAPNPSQAVEHQEPSFMQNTKKFTDGMVSDVNNFAKIGLGINESPFAPKSNTNEPSFDTLSSVKSLTKTNNPGSWRKNVEQVLQSKGYSNVRFANDNKIVATSQDGRDQNISGGFIKDTLASLVGDKYKETGAVVGATKGFNYASKLPIPNPLLKGGAVALGTAIGAGFGGLTGDAVDQAEANINHDEQLNTKERFAGAGSAANDSMISEVAGYGVGKSITAIPDAMKLAKEGTSNYLTKKVYGEVANQQNPKELKNILELADKAGIKLLPSQLTDNKAIDQLSSVIAQNPVLSQKMNVINKDNKVAMKDNIYELLNKIGIDSTKLMSGENIDPLANDIKKSLSDVKSMRGQQVQNAYDLFESSVTGKGRVGSQFIDQKLISLKEESLTMPNPESFNRVLDSIGSRLIEMENKKGYLDAKDLNNLSKQINQIYKRNFDDSSSRAAVMMLKPTIDEQLENLSKMEGKDVYDALKSAKDLYIKKESIYGKTSQLPFGKTINNEAIETIVDDLLKSKQGITNAKALKEELLMLPNGNKVLGSLSRRFIDESLQSSSIKNSVFSSKEINSQELLNAFNNVDYRQLEILTDNETVKKMHSIRKLTELIAKQDKALSGNGGGLNTMGMVRSNIIDKVIDFIRIRTFGKIITTPATQELLLKSLQNVSEKKNVESLKDLIELNKIKDK